MNAMSKLIKAVVVSFDTEEGLGAALSCCYAENNRPLFVARYTLEKVEKIAAPIWKNGSRAATDTTREGDIIRLFDVAIADDVGAMLSLAEEYDASTMLTAAAYANLQVHMTRRAEFKENT